MGHVHPFGAQGFQVLVAVLVLADAADHGHLRAEPGGGDRLVAAFPAQLPVRREAHQGLPGSGMRGVLTM